MSASFLAKRSILKKILLVLMNIMTESLPDILQEIGYAVVRWKTTIADDYDKSADELNDILDNSYYAVMMYDFIPQFANVCYDKDIYYISWIVDCPHFSLRSKSVYYHKNRIFTFDKIQYEWLKNRGVDNSFYLPLGADVRFFDRILRQNIGGHKNQADVCFMGNLYNGTDRNLFSQINFLPPYINGFFNGLMQAQKKIYNNIINKESIPDDIWCELKKYIKFEVQETDEEFYEEQIINMLQSEVTCRERCQAVSLLNRFFDFSLYTSSNTDFDSKILNLGYLDYETQMPFVFSSSKVNLNITLRTITSGIPLRALDIMACGGFLLSNYQPELYEYFVDKKECVFFYDLEDMVEKTRYYLNSDEERRKIARAGYEKVKRDFSLEKQLLQLQQILEDNE